MYSCQSVGPLVFHCFHIVKHFFKLNKVMVGTLLQELSEQFYFEPISNSAYK
jgi:hypothetical protein